MLTFYQDSTQNNPATAAKLASRRQRYTMLLRLLMVRWRCAEGWPGLHGGAGHAARNHGWAAAGMHGAASCGHAPLAHQRRLPPPVPPPCSRSRSGPLSRCPSQRLSCS